MTSIRATFRVTTPMFCGGADQKQPELRAPSFKGVLRYWWRACAWSRLDGNLSEINHEERLVFGSAAGESDIGRSRVTVRIVGPSRPRSQPASRLRALGVRYLGYGLAEQDRSAFEAGVDLTVELGLHPRLGDDQRASVTEALRALGTFGGMGARSRRGYGSLSLTALVVDGEPVDVACASQSELERTIGALARGREGPAVPDYTALSGGSRFVIGPARSEWVHALDDLGQAYQQHRKFSADETDTRACKRASFGLPASVAKAKTVVKPDGLWERRASPLFFHAHQCSDGVRMVVSFLPARFLPKRRIVVGNTPVQMPDESELYEPVSAFLRLLCEEKRFSPVRGERS